MTGRVDGGALGLNVDVGDGFKNDLSTQLIGLTLEDGTRLDTYCVEIETPLDRAEPLVEKEWDDYPDQASPFNQDRDKINFILLNGFPQRNTNQLGKVLTDRGVALNDGSLSVKEAVAGTQAAIWHFSDRTDLNQEEPVPGDARSGADVLALYEFLIGPDNVGVSDEPNAALQIDPEQRSGEAGERIGPFTVRTNGAIDELATALPDGVRVTDAEGRQLRANQIVDTSKLFFDVPAETAAGAASFRLTATTAVATGRLFVGEDNLEEGERTQSLIVASSEDAELTATADADWVEAGADEDNGEDNGGDNGEDNGEDDNGGGEDNGDDVDENPAPQGNDADDDLAETGASILTPLIIGGVLVAAGAGSLLFFRRRRA
ncbi:Cys-Gln thioester bond-forming surface protein [Actinophytocola sp.]|uniref:Cys-Gln thioester bond-forming surface protein n=1 Tax=Actinophytocola sp. TaxID=1872138 RepID=UPI003D6C1BA1